MTISGGVFTLTLALLAAQGPRAGGGKSKGTHVSASTPKPMAASVQAHVPAKAVRRRTTVTSPRPHVAPATRRSDRGAATARQDVDSATTATTGAATVSSSAAPLDGADSRSAAGNGDGTAATGTATTKPAKTKVYTFGAMDVEGKLKTPQLLYFLNRVKLELEMSAPDHRSFMKELEKTAEDSNL